MSRPWSVTELEERIPELDEAIDDAVTDLKRLGDKSARELHAFKLARARAMLDAIAKGAANADAREATVTIAVEKEMLDAQLSGNAYQDQRVVIQALRTRADIARTMMVSRRESPG